MLYSYSQRRRKGGGGTRRSPCNDRPRHRLGVMLEFNHRIRVVRQPTFEYFFRDLPDGELCCRYVRGKRRSDNKALNVREFRCSREDIESNIASRF